MEQELKAILEARFFEKKQAQFKGVESFIIVLRACSSY